MENKSSAQSHESFIDWMKATGMILILIGHVFGSPHVLFNSVTAPIYSKQLGVAFFIFIAGWGLAHNQRDRAETAYRRLFDLLFFGSIFAVFMSAVTWFQARDLAESNYLPLMLGANVFFNYFPANPTTWYIGMYTQLIVLWWWLMPRRVALWMLPVALVVEIAARALILEADRAFTAYMSVSNWVSVFLLGFLLADRRDHRRPIAGLALLVAWMGALLYWNWGHENMAFDGSFPTRFGKGEWLSPWLVSTLVSVMYLVNTVFAFFVFRSFRAPAPIRFIARHTLFIFILHMPLIYASANWIYGFSSVPLIARSMLIVFVLVTLALLSAFVHRLLPVAHLRDAVWKRLKHLTPRAHAGA
ncbi:MAG: acyltransferase [Pseudomonadota bacterium]